MYRQAKETEEKKRSLQLSIVCWTSQALEFIRC
jgi:hypothetical protein